MIERVAAAIVQSYGDDPLPYGAAWEVFHGRAKDAARAAILAMQPSINAIIDKHNPGESDYDDWWARVLKEKIDAALKEPT